MVARRESSRSLEVEECLRRGDTAAAERLLGPARPSDGAREHTSRGRIAALHGRWAAARDHLQMAVALEPTRPLARACLAGVYLYEGRGADALRESLLALRFAPALPVALFVRAEALWALGRQPEALDAGRTLAKLAPEHLVGRWVLANRLVATEHPDEAAAQLRALTRLFPDVEGPHVALCALWVRRGRPEHALSHLEGAIRQAPWVAELWLLRAEIQVHTGLHEPFLAVVPHMRAVCGKEPDLLHRLGCLLLRVGHATDAFRLWTQVALHHPQHARTQHALSMLDAQDGYSELALARLEHAATHAAPEDWQILHDLALGRLESQSAVAERSALELLGRLAAEPSAHPRVLRTVAAVTGLRALH